MKRPLEHTRGNLFYLLRRGQLLSLAHFIGFSAPLSKLRTIRSEAVTEFLENFRLILAKTRKSRKTSIPVGGIIFKFRSNNSDILPPNRKRKLRDYDF